MSTDFTPGTTAKGTPCKRCVDAGERCAQHPEDSEPTRQTQRARKGQWETPYFAALKAGYTKASAAGFAGVHQSTPYDRAKTDPDFAAQEAVAYQAGTHRLEKRALERIDDDINPSDTMLKHLLAVRGVNPNQKLEHLGKGGERLTINLVTGGGLAVGED